MIEDHPNAEENSKNQEDTQPESESFETNSEKTSQQPKQVMMTDVELRHLQKELMDYKDKYLRLLADGENVRKRMQKERQELTKYAVENVINEFLHPLDNLENALKFAQQMSEEVKNWALGFQMILTQFKDVLSSNGVTAFESVGKQFDPNTHEAVEILVTKDYPAGTIVEEYIRGYKMGDRTIRPARVKVAKEELKEIEQQSE